MAAIRKLAKDEYLFREGDPPDAMYVVKSGKIAVTKSKQSGGEVTLAEIGPGAMVGEMAFFDNKPRSANVKAAKDSELIALPYKSLHAQFQQFPEWCKAIMRTVNDHLRDANQRIKSLERNDDKDLFPPHTINKLMSILNLVGYKYGKQSEEGLLIPPTVLRNYTIQIFQEATHKMQKLMGVLSEINFMKVEDIGEGRQKVVIYQPELMFAFVEWHNDWLFKSEKDRITITEPELKILKGIAQYAKETPPTPKGEIKLNLTDVQNNSMKDLGWVIKIDDVNPLIEKKLMGDKLMEEAGVFSTVRLEDMEKMAPFWEILYSLKKLSR